MVSCDRPNGDIMHTALDASPSAPCIINRFLEMRFMKSRRYVCQTAWQSLAGKESRGKDAKVNIGEG